ncbi:GFA family protein [Amorphus sp. MBR-141]
MTMTEESRAGGCACGAVRFTATVKGAHMDACHCETCRRWSAGPLMGIEVGDFAVVDEAALGVWNSSEWAERLFCKTCGTSLAYRTKDGRFVTVSAFAFDEPTELPLAVEVFIDSKPSTYALAGDTKKMTGAELFAMFQGN